MKILISVDMEGVADITNSIQCRRDSSEFENSCALMTGEAKAACEGAAFGGATEILVNDSHGDMRNIDHEKLPSNVQLIRGSVKPLSMVQGLEAGVSAVVFIGYHAAAATAGGILDHTYWGAQVHRVSINGETCSEARLNAAMAGDIGTPAIFISGDQSACSDAVHFMPWIKSVSVKQAFSRTSAICMSPAEARNAISNGVADAVRSIADGIFKPYILEKPIRLDVTLMGSEKADVAAMIPGVERVDATTVRYIGDAAFTVFRASMAIMRVASTVV